MGIIWQKMAGLGSVLSKRESIMCQVTANIPNDVLSFTASCRHVKKALAEIPRRKSLPGSFCAVKLIVFLY